MTSPADLRAQIPTLDRVRYMNAGASGPSPKPVVEAAESMLRRHEFDSHAEEGPYPLASETYEEVRGVVADFLGAGDSEIALTQSTADGITSIASAIEWEPGDTVVRTDLEHPAGVLPWAALEREGVDARVVESEGGRIDREAYAEAVRDAKLVCLSALTWNYGTHLPVSELVDIAHESGAFVLVDAVQVPGHARFDVTDWGADAVAAAGHKWLLGTWGAGFLYVEESVANELHPGAVGYRSVETPTAESYEFKRGAPRFEVGTTNLAPYAALREAIRTMEDVGLDAVERRIDELAARLAEGVPDDRLVSPASPESGLVSFTVEDPERTVEALKERGFVLRSIPAPEGAVRASLHVYNTEEDVDRLLDALDDAGW
ncbi:aminotransferase class V-fold PLP-dependent enzyme [Halopelagius longus]|uniref:Aminotransferase class V-fold PLP-dependent enzyme n=1 Tax=Halopelagius longus TaxID=1236180 RepID=A0A1H1GHN4_9EURY|nr:aminotransferase class V-fold PLP-dependent enzyme [Halopelagius longus]RDI69749.1 aminotransferase class V-fold PLP-dependent enzyme [Halopelagius longus]SDR12701.1 Selenocysteine lyase/Cysteine desulfurase [Halopelagius longus]